MLTNYDILLDDNREVRIAASSWESACDRAADLYQTTVMAWRYPRVELVIGQPTIVG